MWSFMIRDEDTRRASIRTVGGGPRSEARISRTKE
jgi:hypothetical protein